MVLKDNQSEEKKKISVGLICSREDLKSNPIFAGEIMKDVSDAPYYLLIFISREDVLKISVFLTENKDVKKILIKLKEFSPDLVKGISSKLKELRLSKNILHTTGLCYELENCYYETYLTGEDFSSEKITADVIEENFMSIAKVISVEIEEIPMLTL